MATELQLRGICHQLQWFMEAGTDSLRRSEGEWAYNPEQDLPGFLLPGVARRLYGTSMNWLHRFVGSADRLRLRLIADHAVSEASFITTADRILGWQALNYARDLGRDDPEHQRITAEYDVTGSTIDRVLITAADDRWEALEDELFPSPDFLVLYDPAMEGIESRDLVLAVVGVHDRLHPSQWFKEPMKETT